MPSGSVFSVTSHSEITGGILDFGSWREHF